MLYRLDSFHLEYPTAPSPACKPLPSISGALSLVRFNVQHSRDETASPLKYKKNTGLPHPALYRALKLARSNHC